MKYTYNEIPGLINLDVDLPAFRFFASKLPDDCKILEIGSLVGKSSVAWATVLAESNKKYHIHCIDLFQYSPHEFLSRMAAEYGLIIDGIESLSPSITQDEAFKLYTSGYNITHASANCMDYIPTEKVHCVFEDSSHDYTTLSHCLLRWWDSLLPGGVLCGHDYNDICPGVKQASAEIATLVGKPLFIYPNSEIWYIIKD